MLAVTPYQGLGDFIMNCAKSFPDISVDVCMGNMRVAALNLDRYQGYDVVVSRGGTAEILREKLLIPVISVGVSVYDMLRVIKSAQQTGKKFAVVGFAGLIKTSQIICEIMRYKVPAYTITSEEDAGRMAKKLAGTDIELVVGDVIATDYAALCGLNTLLITSGVESVEQAFSDTMELFQNMERAKQIYFTKAAKSAEHEECLKISLPNPAWQQSSSPAFLDAERLRATVETLMDGPKRQIPVIILARPGSGAAPFARYIHSAGPFKNSPFITIDCRALEKCWNSLIKHSGSLLHDLKCTVFLEDVQTLSYNAQNTLAKYMDDTLLAKRHHVIASSSADLVSLTAAGGFLPALYQKLNGLTITLPALSERPEEIPALAGLFISQYNRECAKQIIGFEEEAMAALKSAPWDFNVEQLQNLIRHLVILTQKPYITLAGVQTQLTTLQAPKGHALQIKLNKTLDEIETDVIREVLREEGMNQSRAAKRLGIGRSTLWRKLNQ